MSHKVENFASTLSLAELKKKRLQLRNIRMAVAKSLRGSMGPRFERASIGSVAAAAALLGIGKLLEATGVHVVWSALWWSAFILGLVIHLWVNIKSKFPRLWIDLIDAKLSEYEPVDKEAFRHLQHHTREAGYLELAYVREWISTESYALDIAGGRFTPKRNLFLDKQM
ncbi:hypothetical protein ACFFU8_09600 [Chromobacterium piscinae]|uniref:hypothetical protein n=1 Tax=Chromobacterium piscinae TaxID=686831 RepID=UPI001E4A2F67|nr:hypothetical protein [Chromobacterium piscinae]MCD5327841.1 hypothetical protein [Chromobacterium piscinae]